MSSDNVTISMEFVNISREIFVMSIITIGVTQCPGIILPCPRKLNISRETVVMAMVTIGVSQCPEKI
jgi:hypothetical protein